MSDNWSALIKDFSIDTVSRILDDAEERKAWGSVTVTFQNGHPKTIKKEETIVIPKKMTDNLENETRKSN